jgi:hypothetical protein
MKRRVGMFIERRLSAPGKRRLYIGIVLLLLAANLLVGTRVFAHQWANYHLNTYGAYAYVPVYNDAYYWYEANDALNDWHYNTVLDLWYVDYDYSQAVVYDGGWGYTGWAGLATLHDIDGYGHIGWGSAVYNWSYDYAFSYYGKQAIFCQEVGHVFGLDHSNDGGCMGAGYWYSANYYYYTVAHNWNDIWYMYRYSHH